MAKINLALHAKETYKLQPSISAQAISDITSPVGCYIACLIVFILDINLEKGDKDTLKFKINFARWAATATPFSKKHGTSKAFGSFLKKFKVGNGYTFDEDAISEVGKNLVLDKKGSFARDLSISRDAFGLLMDCGRYLKKDNDSSWRKIEKNISVLREPGLSAAFVSDDDAKASEPILEDGISPKAASKEMPNVYKKLFGRSITNGYMATVEDLKEASTKKKALFEQYKMLSKTLNSYTKLAIFKKVRSSGKATIPIEWVSKELDSKGILHNMPVGFVGGQVDERGDYYTKEGRKLDKRPMGKVTMNPNYDPASDNTYVLNSNYVTKGGSGRARTITMNTSNKQKRHAAADTFLSAEDKYRSKWIKDLDRKGSREQVIAAMVEMLWDTACRIGGVGNKSAGEPTYGLTTLLASHVKIKTGKILFDYVGKKNAPQPATYRTSTPIGKKVEAVVLKLLRDKSKNDLLFQWRDKPVNPNAVNAYLKEIGCPIKAHGFRRVAGTKVANQILATSPFKKMLASGKQVSESEVTRWFKEELKAVGEVLHHSTGETVTAMTSVKSYISPEIMIKFYEDLGMRVPKFIPSI